MYVTDYVRMYISSEDIFCSVSPEFFFRNSNLNEFRFMQYDTANTYLWFYVPDAINLVLNKINNTPSVPPPQKSQTNKKKRRKKRKPN